ncbi:MAG: FAD-binding protein, partial [Lactiplantibacillus plantarum]|nr:FAD-binding protein [Lactiplantibacillus plantarum]
VLNQDERPIAGLFAAGEVVGGLHGNNRIGGNSIAETVIFGRQAGQQMFKYLQ